MAEQPDQIPQFLAERPTSEELSWMRRGLGQPGGKIPVFDENDNPVDPKIVRRCLEQQWVEPWIGNQKNPNNLYMACRLSPLGRRLVGREPQLVDRDVKDKQDTNSDVSSTEEGKLDRDKKNQMLLETLEVMARRSRRDTGFSPRVARLLTYASIAVLLFAVPLVIWQGWRLIDQSAPSQTQATTETTPEEESAPVAETASPGQDNAGPTEPDTQVAQAVEPETAAPDLVLEEQLQASPEPVAVPAETEPLTASEPEPAVPAAIEAETASSKPAEEEAAAVPAEPEPANEPSASENSPAMSGQSDETLAASTDRALPPAEPEPATVPASTNDSQTALTEPTTGAESTTGAEPGTGAEPAPASLPEQVAEPVQAPNEPESTAPVEEPAQTDAFPTPQAASPPPPLSLRPWEPQVEVFETAEEPAVTTEVSPDPSPTEPSPAAEATPLSDETSTPDEMLAPEIAAPEVVMPSVAPPPEETPIPGIAASAPKMVEVAVLPPVKPAPPAPVIEAPTGSPPASQPAASSSSGMGDFGVQVAASQDPAEAERLRELIAERQTSLLSDYELTIVKADIEGKGVYYRVRIPAFGNRSVAAGLCQSLKASGQDCFVFRAQP